jgi:surfactin synthase thioesterase subunit
MSSVESWFPYRRAASGFELFAFPHAGGATTVFSDLREALGRGGIALSAAVLPGHGRRVRETPHRRMEPLLAEFGEMARSTGFSAFMGDYGLLGHCSGALIAYEIAKLLVRAPCRNPRLFVVCSCLPPRLIFDTGMGRLPTRELLAQTAAMGGSEDQLMADPDFVTMIERPLRADWEMYDGYRHRPAAPLPLPILAVRGTEDGNVDLPDMRLWQEQTDQQLLTAELDSDHWVIDEKGSARLAREISAAVAAVRPG